jgi:hypothetical protein
VTTTDKKLSPDLQACVDAGERFQRDTEGFTLHVLHDDGLYKHLRFHGPKGRSFYWFDLVTWPGHLTFRGDAGCFTFARTEDMLAFFRSNPDRDYGDPFRINASYWAEKVQGTLDNGRDAVRRYDSDVLARRMREQAEEHAEDEDWPKIVRESLLRSVKEHIEDELIGERGSDLDTAYAFRFALTDPEHDGTWEWSPSWEAVYDANDTTYDWSFLWACHAIVWGIEQYDEHRAQTAAATIRARLGVGD